MNKEQYFMTCMKAQAFMRKAWVLRAFAVTKLKDIEAAVPEYPYELFTDGKYYCYLDPDNGAVIRIVGASIKEPLFDYRRGIDVSKEDVISLDKDARVSYGTLLFNFVSLISTLGKKIPFQHGKCDIGKIESLIISKLMDDVAEGEQEDPDKIYCRELVKYVQHTVEVSGYSQLCVPSATPKSIAPAPGYKELYTRLMTQHKHELNDPTVIAKIRSEFEKLDRAWIDSDPDKGFYQSDKSFQVIRMRMYYMFGLEKNFTDDGFTFVPQPLEEGWDIDYLPQMTDSLRDGSFSRGAMTAIGGEKTKTIFRMTSGIEVSEEDCGTKLGIKRVMNDTALKVWEGSYVLLGKDTMLITKDTASMLKGKEVVLRNPGYCKSSNNNHCLKCVGEFIRGMEKGLPAAGASVGSTLMQMQMKKMHGTALKTKRYELSSLLR